MPKTPEKNMNIDRRKFLKTTASAAALSAPLGVFSINHSWSKDVMWDGQPFNARGATIRINEWGGIWQDFINKEIISKFEKTYNCKVAYDSSFPWFPKYVASGVRRPAFHVGNWNLNEIVKLSRVGDFFLTGDELKENLPNAPDCWDFAFQGGLGVTWGFGQYAYAYRTDKIGAVKPTGFKTFWDRRLAGKRATYITSNSLQQVFFMVSAAEWGAGQSDMRAGFDAMRRAMPMKISDFTGNMQTLIERGEVIMGVQWDGEIFLMMDKGLPVAPLYWGERKPILTQTHTISRYSRPIEKKLALALVNMKLEPEFQNKVGKVFYMRPSNKKAIIPERLANKGVTNSANAMEGLWIPDWNWYLDNEDEITETVNEIFSAY